MSEYVALSKYILFMAERSKLKIDNDHGVITYDGEVLDIPFPSICIKDLKLYSGIGLEGEERLKLLDIVTKVFKLSTVEQNMARMNIIVNLKIRRV